MSQRRGAPSVMRRSIFLCLCAYVGALGGVPEAGAVVPREGKGARLPSSPRTATPTTPDPRRAITPAGAAGAIRPTDGAGRTPRPAAPVGARKGPERAEVFVRDTFYGVDGDSLLGRSGEAGATWTRHPKYPSNVDKNWVLSDEGRAYYGSGGYRGALYLASGVPDGNEYDLRMTWHVKTVPEDTDHGIVFRYDAATDTGYKLTYRTYTRRWELRLIKDGAATDLASYPQTLSPNADYGVLVQVRAGWIRVKIDEVTRMTARETTIKAAGRVGLWGYGIPGSTPTTGIHIDKFLAASSGYAPPHYDLTGPPTGAPGVPSADYTVALEKGVNPGAVTITPTASGLPGAFSRAAVTLTDASRSATFAFTPAGIGTGTISVGDGGRLRDPPAATFTSSYGPPARLAYFESQIPWPCAAGASRYTAGTGYWLDGTEHYDPILCFYNARDYCKRKGLPAADWSAAIAAAIVRYRDRAVIANGGVAGWHAYSSGCARHYLETRSRESLAAVGILNPKVSFASLTDGWKGHHVSREVAFMLMDAIEAERVGMGDQPRVDLLATRALGHLDEWSRPPETRLWATFVKPFMVALSCRSLIAYWHRYRDAKGDRGAIVAAIPGAVKRALDWLWENAWYPPVKAAAMGDGTWDKGTFTYMDLDGGGAIPEITGQAIRSVTSNCVFRGPDSLSPVDGYYKHAGIEFTTGVNDNNDRYSVIDYTGSTRTFTLSAAYHPTAAPRAGDLFTLHSGIDRDGGPGPTPDLNHMIAPAYAWAYWHEKAVNKDARAAAPWRARHDAIFNGGSMSWGPPTAQKQWNQALLWSTLGLDWRDRGDAVQVP